MNVMDVMDEAAARELAGLYKAMAHPVRLYLLQLLSQEEACVCHLTCLLRRPQPYISQQLGILRAANLVVDRREGQVVYYAVTDPTVVELITVGQRFLGQEALIAEMSVVPHYPLPGCTCPRCVSE